MASALMNVYLLDELPFRTAANILNEKNQYTLLLRVKDKNVAAEAWKWEREREVNVWRALTDGAISQAVTVTLVRLTD